MNGHVVKSQAQYIEVTNKASSVDTDDKALKRIGARQNHCLAAVYDMEYYDRQYGHSAAKCT